MTRFEQGGAVAFGMGAAVVAVLSAAALEYLF
jgi:hypothetical protein